MKLYEDYLKERLDAVLIYDDTGFVAYKRYPNYSIFMLDAYIKPEFRNRNSFLNFAKKINEKEDIIKFIFCESFFKANNWTISDKFIKSWGLAPISENEESILYMVEVDSNWKTKYLGQET
jgi:hypothetical protein